MPLAAAGVVDQDVDAAKSVVADLDDLVGAFVGVFIVQSAADAVSAVAWWQRPLVAADAMMLFAPSSSAEPLLACFAKYPPR